MIKSFVVKQDYEVKIFKGYGDEDTVDYFVLLYFIALYLSVLMFFCLL